MTGALDGVRVLELGTLIAGPFAARFLGEFGADVIKIEDPKGGDPLRKWRKLYPEVGGTSLWWAVQARNKKSVTINLKADEGKEYLKRQTSGLRDSANDLLDKGREAVGRQRDNLNDAIDAGKQAYREKVEPNIPGQTA